MAPSNPHMVEFVNKKDVPPEFYILYDMVEKKIWGVKRDQYMDFVNHYFINHQNGESVHLTMDLAFARTHSLMFDIDIKVDSTCKREDIENYLTSVVKPIITSTFCQLTCYTFILASRRDGYGLHVHFPEFVISHDDYIIFCTQLQPQLEFKSQNFTASLDIVKNFNLSHSSKPNTRAYTPFSINFVENSKVLILPVLSREHHAANVDYVRKHFRMKKCNTNTFFREIINLPYDILLKKTFLHMMPVCYQSNVFQIHYPTFIGYEDKLNCQIIGHFTFMGAHLYQIYKEFNFSIDFKNTFDSVAYKYIMSRGMRITDFTTENHALNQWFEQSQTCCNLREDIFKNINFILRQDNQNNPTFQNMEHPLKTIMEFDNGYYFLPVFYALCNYLKLPSSTLVNELTNVLSSPVLLHEIGKINDEIMAEIASYFTIDTILYCGSNLASKSNKFANKLESVLVDMKSLIESCTTTDDLAQIIVRIVNRYVPIMVATMKGSCNKTPKKYMWNIVKEQWQEYKSDIEIKYIVTNINNKIKKMLKGRTEKVKMAQNLNIYDVVATISSETNMDRVDIMMDKHKWHLKTPAGVLDLLTGHVGATVPEFFLSDINLGIPLSREKLMGIRTDSQLIKVYQTLVSKDFFRCYLKNLFLDLTDDFFDTLKVTAQEFNIYDETNELVMSMLNFYVHICKYMSFEFDLLEYMLDVLASILIATNYARHFYILQGITGNGKSKFFEMITKLFEGYCQPIRNVNLQPGKGINAQPELAAGLFSKRIVAIEEMHGNIDENLIKELTGNSFTSFRKLYENNQGGIPTAKLIASTNKPPCCTATEAFNARVIAIPFSSEFKPFYSIKKTSYQVKNNKYKMETNDNIVNMSYKGFFAILYIRLFENIDMQNGYLNLRPEPDVIVEFKDFYMSMTSIYMQFKQFADVQIIPGATTTENDLISAVRQFLKDTKKTGSIDQQQIVKEFNEEFKNYKRTETQDSLFESSALDDYLEEMPPAKKRKMDCIVFYEGIAIKNLKKIRI